jgi:hypothetical protein
MTKNISGMRCTIAGKKYECDLVPLNNDKIIKAVAGKISIDGRIIEQREKVRFELDTDGNQSFTFYLHDAECRVRNDTITCEKEPL